MLLICMNEQKDVGGLNKNSLILGRPACCSFTCYKFVM